MNLDVGLTQNDFGPKFSEDSKKQIPTQNYDKKLNFDNEILKAFIYIYFYEKIVLEKNIFYNSNKDFYLINTKWIENFKKFY